MGSKAVYRGDVDTLLKLFQKEMRRLVKINSKNDYSAAGQDEFNRQRERIATIKRMIIAESRANRRELVRS